MGPAATAEFLRLLAALAPARRDQDHPRVLVISDPGIPDRTEAILDGGEDPTPKLLAGASTLAGWGADLLAVPCNTAHYFMGRVRGELPIPLVDIVEATLAEARRTGPEGGWLVSTRGTLESGIYEDGAAEAGYRLRLPDEDAQAGIQGSIELVKAGQLERAGARLRETLEHLWGLEELPAVAACTEVPLAYAAAGLPAERMVSSLEALALGCLEELYGPAFRRAWLPAKRKPSLWA
jgi:aspartate racemase